MGTKSKRCGATTQPSKDGHRTSIKPISLRRSGWYWMWKCSPATASQYAQPGLWAWLDRRPREQWPAFLRGDIAWGTERMMEECEKRGLAYLFKMRQTTKVK